MSDYVCPNPEVAKISGGCPVRVRDATQPVHFGCRNRDCPLNSRLRVAFNLPGGNARVKVSLGDHISTPDAASNDFGLSGFVFLPTDEELSSIALVQRLGVAIDGLGLSRRGILDWIANALYLSKFALVYRCMKPFDPTEMDVDLVFNDGSMKYISDLIKHAQIGRKQRPRRCSLPKLRLLVTALTIRHPEIARHLFL